VFIVIHLTDSKINKSKNDEFRLIDSIISPCTFESIKEAGDKYKFYPQIVYKLMEKVDNFDNISTT